MFEQNEEKRCKEYVSGVVEVYSKGSKTSEANNKVSVNNGAILT